MHAGGVFAHQQHGVGVEQRHHDDRTVAAAVQSFVAAALAVAELQVQPLHAVRPGVVLGDAVDRRQAPRHRMAPHAGVDRRVSEGTVFAAIMPGCVRRIIPER